MNNSTAREEWRDVPGYEGAYQVSPQLAVKATSYARIPKWVLLNTELTQGARLLYAVLMSFADSETLTAFPSKTTLAESLGVKERSIYAYVKELEKVGAVEVSKRRNKRTGQYYASVYTLVFDEPSAIHCNGQWQPVAEEQEPLSLSRTTLPLPPSFDEEINLALSRSRSHSEPATSPHMRAREICHQIHQQDAWDLESSLWQELTDELNHLVGQGADIAHTLFNQGWFESLYRAILDSKTPGLGIATWVSKIVAYERQQPHVTRHTSKPAMDPWQV